MTYFNDPHIPRFEHPDYFDAEMHFCEACECEIEAEVAEECGFCEDCLCDDDDCEGCFYCLSTAGYDEAKADGTLKTEPTE